LSTSSIPGTIDDRRVSDDYRQKFTGQLSGGVARGIHCTVVGRYWRVCRILSLESMNLES
jgi:hypothetical protein